MQSLAAASPIESFHGSPGPSHHVASSLLPGSNRRRDGVAVTVTEMTPAGVVMYAVTEIGFHITRGTQNHVPTFTTNLSRAGAVRKTRAFSRSLTLDDTWSTSRVRVVSLIHWYQLSRWSGHVRWNSVSLIPAMTRVTARSVVPATASTPVTGFHMQSASLPRGMPSLTLAVMVSSSAHPLPSARGRVRRSDDETGSARAGMAVVPQARTTHARNVTVTAHIGPMTDAENEGECPDFPDTVG